MEIAAAKHGSDRGIHFAPTVFVNGKTVSGNTGVDINAMLKTICSEYKGTKPAGCKAENIDAIFNSTTGEPCEI